MKASDPLDIIVVGAGIAGLSTGIALRNAGHNVTIYERSDLKNELGAAIHLSPNASRVLLSWGMDSEQAKFVIARSTYIANGKSLKVFYENENTGIVERYGAPWFFAHRVDFHNELKRLALSPVNIGRPVKIIAGSKIESYDSEAGSVTLRDGTQHTADLVIAADGVHSIAGEAVLGYKNPAVPTDQTAFRFLIPTSAIAADTTTAPFLDRDDGRFKIFTGDGKRLIWYPCRNNEEQNFVGIFEGGLKTAPEGKKATRIKRWPLLFRHPIKPWYRSKLVLVGDAAHPMLPHQGQGGAQAVEDAAALGIMFTGITKKAVNRDQDLISRRLELFQRVRLRRGSAMQMFSNAGQDEAASIKESVAPYVDGKIPTNPAEFMEYNFSYNVVDESIKILRSEDE